MKGYSSVAKLNWVNTDFPTPTLYTAHVLTLTCVMKAFNRAVCYHPIQHIKGLFTDLSGNNSKSRFDLIRCAKFRSFVSRLKRVWWWSGRWWRKSLFFPTSRWKTTSSLSKIYPNSNSSEKCEKQNTVHMIREEREYLSQSYHSNDIIWSPSLLSWPPPHP